VAALTGGAVRMKMAARLGMLDRMDHSVRFPCLVVAAALLAGCGTTPGVGIPPVLISGRLAAERITGR